MSTKSLVVLHLEFWNGTWGFGIVEIKKEINESTIEIPKYQLNLTTENNETYHITDCWIDKFEFENHKYERTKCYFLCNDIQQLNTPTEK